MFTDNENIRNVFNAVSDKYDKQRKELIPCFDTFYAVPLELAENTSNVKNILDLGSGTGLLTAFFLEKYPKANFTLVDISDQMLQKAKDRFHGFSNLEFIVESFKNLNFEEESFDLIISGLALHHLNSEEKRMIFKKSFSWLKANGQLINADQVLGEDEYAENTYTENWKNKVIQNQNLSNAEKEATFQRIKLEQMDTLSHQLRWLKESGFKTANNYYQYYNFVVFAATK